MQTPSAQKVRPVQTTPQSPQLAPLKLVFVHTFEQHLLLESQQTPPHSGPLGHLHVAPTHTSLRRHGTHTPWQLR
ncbi:MAG: hypothetical protein JWP02_3360 [Acidimicrobiales bacterium]|nr:hypothetical protein [Acidimicrobiales bacterium]